MQWRVGRVSRYWPFWLLLSMLWAGCRSAESPEKSLLQEFPYARTRPVVAGSGTLGSCTFRAFLGHGLLPDFNAEWVTPMAGVKTAQLGVFLHDVGPLDVTLEGRMRGDVAEKGVTSLPVEFFIADHPLQSVAVPAETTTYKLHLESRWLKPGMNWITMKGCRGTEWLTMKVEASEAGRHVDGRLAVASLDAQAGSLELPFNTRVEFALDPREAASLKTDLEAWVEPGAPELAEGSWKLEVSLASEGVPYQKVGESGPAENVEVPLAPADKPRALALKAVLAEGKPLPGQLGIRLRDPRIALATGAANPTAVSSASPPSAPSGPRRPNVIVYLVDTLRADRLGCYGYSKPTSPNLDKFVGDAVLYEAAMSTAPWTKPSVASLWTSTPPVEHRVVDFMDNLPTDLVTLAEVFQASGYKTAGFVANPLVAPQFQFNQGFDTYEMFPDGIVTEKINEKVLPWLEARKPNQPFFLYVHTIEPHLAYDPPRAFRQAWLPELKKAPKGTASKAVLSNPDPAGFLTLTNALVRRSFEADPLPIPQATTDNVNLLYDGEVASNDDAFGKLLEKLKATGLYDDTIIVFVSDHGEELLDRDQLGHLSNVFQELVRIPLVVKYAGNQHAGGRVRDLCQVTDVMPTVLEEAGLPVPKAATGQLLPVRDKTGEAGSRALIVDVEVGRHAKALKQPINFLIDVRGVRVGDWKAAISYSAVFVQEPFVLFDMKADPGERRNLWTEQPVRALHMESLIRRYDEHRKSGAETDVLPAEAERMLRSLQYLR